MDYSDSEIKLDQTLLERHGVLLVLLFGSAVTGSRHPDSDVDIGVLFKNPGLVAKNPVLVYGDLQAEFSKHFRNKKIDVVYFHEAPLSLQFKAMDAGVVLFESLPAAFADFKEKIMREYFDFRFFEDILNAPFIKAA